jgi:hypothetical protein
MFRLGDMCYLYHTHSPATLHRQTRGTFSLTDSSAAPLSKGVASLPRSSAALALNRACRGVSVLAWTGVLCATKSLVTTITRGGRGPGSDYDTM